MATDWSLISANQIIVKHMWVQHKIVQLVKQVTKNLMGLNIVHYATVMLGTFQVEETVYWVKSLSPHVLDCKPSFQTVLLSILLKILAYVLSVRQGTDIKVESVKTITVSIIIATNVKLGIWNHKGDPTAQLVIAKKVTLQVGYNVFLEMLLWQSVQVQMGSFLIAKFFISSVQQLPAGNVTAGIHLKITSASRIHAQATIAIHVQQGISNLQESLLVLNVIV